jgi:hypothetical protein
MTQDTKIVDGINNINETTQKTLDSIKNKKKVEETLENFLDQQQKLEREDLEAMGLRLKPTRSEALINDNKDNEHNKEIINYNKANLDNISFESLSSLAFGNEVESTYPEEKDAAAQIQPTNDLPAEARTLKIDLFNNTTDINTKPYDYKVSVSMYLYKGKEVNRYDSQTPVRWMANFNDTSTKSFNLFINKSDPHYRNARYIRDLYYMDAGRLGIEHLSLNKFYMPNSTGGCGMWTRNFSGMLLRTSQTHIFFLFINDKTYSYDLSLGKITKPMKRKGIIGSFTARNEDRLKLQQVDAKDIFK